MLVCRWPKKAKYFYEICAALLISIKMTYIKVSVSAFNSDPSLTENTVLELSPKRIKIGLKIGIE